MLIVALSSSGIFASSSKSKNSSPYPYLRLIFSHPYKSTIASDIQIGYLRYLLELPIIGIVFSGLLGSIIFAMISTGDLNVEKLIEKGLDINFIDNQWSARLK